MIALHQPSQPTMCHPARPDLTIKAGIAAGLGPSLVLCHSLPRISTHILRVSQSTLQYSPQPSLLSLDDYDNTGMGNCVSSPDKGYRSQQHGHSQSTELLNPRPVAGSRVPLTQSQQANYGTHQYQPRKKSKPPKPEFVLQLYCQTCAHQGTSCSYVTDMNVNHFNKAYYRDPSYRGDLKVWGVKFDFCGTWSRENDPNFDFGEWSRQVTAVKKVLARYMPDGGYMMGWEEDRKKKKEERAPFSAEALKMDLKAERVLVVHSGLDLPRGGTPEYV